MTRPAPRIAAAAGLFLAGLFISGCASCPTTCNELKSAADAIHCPERIVETTVTVFDPVDVGELDPAPPLTAATVPDGATVAEALQALAADLKATREWAFTMYHKLQALKRADGGTQ